MTKVLATSFDQGGVNAISPVIRKLSSIGIDVVTIGQGKGERFFKNQKISYKTLKYYGLNEINLDSMEKILKKEKPDLVLTGTSPPRENYGPITIDQTAILTARLKGIRSVSVLDMWGEYIERFSGINNTQRLKFLPNKIAIMDEVAQKAMVREGIPKELLVVTGNPYFDRHKEIRKRFRIPEDKERIHKDLGIPKGNYVILFVSQPIKANHPPNEFGYNEETVLRELLEASKNIKDKLPPFTILVKGHPDKEKENLEPIISEYKDDLSIILNKDYDIKLVILASDVLVTMTSTAAVEAAYLSSTIPIISLQPGLKGEDKLITNSLGLSHGFFQKGELQKTGILKDILLNKPSEELIKKRLVFMESNDGEATERVTDLVLSMI